MNFKEFSQAVSSCYEIDNEFLIWKLRPNLRIGRCVLDTTGYHMVVHIIIEDGDIQVKLGDNELLLTKGSYSHFIDHSSIEFISVSWNIRAYVMAATDLYNVSLFKNNPPIPISMVLQAKEQPVQYFDASTISLLNYRMENIELICADSNHIFQSNMIKCAFFMFLMDISNIHISKSQEIESTPTGRKKELNISFIKLLQKYASKEHSSTFFASKLCVTPQYLNRIVKEQTGKTVYDWICLTIVGEITKRLENTNDTMQQIALDFNFSDQSALSKFYKKQTGLSLTEYRKKIKPR